MVQKMTDPKSKVKAKKTAKPTAIKAVVQPVVVAEKLAVESAPTVKPQEKLVTNIVPVEQALIKLTPIKTGVEIMTNTAEKTAETVTAKAKDIFADMQVRAGEAAEKGKKLAADAYEFNKANMAAMIEAGKIAAKGAQDLGTANVEFVKSNFAEMQVAFKEITAVRTPTDFIKVQTELAKKGFDTAIAQGSKNTETMVKLVSEMFQPISNRIAVTTDLFKKAA
jgi:phasin family protein